MATYFAASTDDAAVAASSSSTSDGEAINAVIAPGSDAFAALIELIYGKALAELDADQQSATVSAPDAAQSLVRIGRRLRDTVADLEADMLQNIAVPWSESDAVQDVDVDPAEFLTDLQHLCRNAIAIDSDVYAVGAT